MRQSTLVFVPALLASALFTACGTDGGGGPGGGDDDDDPPPPVDEPAFKVTSTDITLQPGEEVTKCFYFHTPNTENVKVTKWVSDLTPGSHHMIFFSNLGGNQPPDGTIDDCQDAGTPLPLFGTQIEHEELAFPTDDAGVQLAQIVTPNTAGYFQMHYLNATDAELTAHVELSAFPLPEGETFTRTDLFGTYNADIEIPPNATDVTVSATCGVVDGKFWHLTTHSHKQSATTRILDGATELLTSDDWEHPAVAEFAAPDFHQFTGGTLTWECTYNNTGSNAANTVVDGQSAETNEMCMAIGYYFPAVGPRGCIFAGGQCQCLL